MGYQTAEEWLKQKNGSTSSGGGKTSSGGESSSGRYQTAEEWMKQKYSPEKLEEQYTQANSWLDRYNKLITGFSDFDKKRNGGFAKDVGGGYGEEISALLRDFDGFQEYLGVLGLSDATQYASNLRKLQKGINDGNQFMAQFADEDAYNLYVTERDDYESKRTANLTELEEEIARLKQQRENARNREFDWTDYMQRSAYDQYLKDQDSLISQKKQFLNQARQIQEQERLSGQREQWLEKYQGSSYRELKSILGELDPSGAEHEWVSAYAESVMNQDDYTEQVLKNTAELKYLEEGSREIAALAGQIAMGGETEADKAKYDALVRQYGGIQELQKRIEALKSEIWKDQNALKYGFLNENEDYGEMSRQQGDVKKAGLGIGFGTKWWGQGDPVYRYINNIDGAREVVQKGKTPYSVYDFMTDEDVANYNYLYNAQGKKAAQEYLDYLSYDLEHRQMGKFKENTAELATNHPIVSSALSVPTNLGSGLGVLDVAGQNLMREISGEYKPIHYERGSMAPTAFTTTIRGTVAQNIADATGTIELDEEDHPFWGKVLNGKSLGDIYQLGMSMADSAAVAALAFAGVPGGTALLGGSAASQGVLDALENGANDTQALSMGILNGTFEMLFEEVSLDKLLKGSSGSVIKDILRQGGVEGSEEFFTTLANTVADILVMADKSGYQSDIERYMREDGLDRKQATIKALQNVAIGMGWDFVGGFLSGGMMGGMAMPIHTYMQGASLQKAGVTGEQLTQLGKTFSQDSKTGKMVGKAGNDSGAFNMGRLYNRISTELSNQNAADIQKTLEDKGMDKSIAKKHAQILETIAEGGTLSDTQMRTIEKNEILSQTMEEIIRNPDSTVNQRLRGYEDIVNKLWAIDDQDNGPRAEQMHPGQEKGGTDTHQAIHNLEGKTIDAAVSEDGKTRIVSTGQDTEIQKIASIRDGNITFQMEDGSLVDAGDIAYGSEGEAIIYDAVASLGVGPEMANVLADGFTTSRGVPAAVYAKGMQDAFWYGKWGAPMQEMESGVYTSQLTELQRQNAYQVGRMMAQEEASAKQEQRKQEAALKKGQKQPGKVHFEGDTEKLTKKQKTNMQALETIADALGIQIYVFESETAPSPDGKGTVRIGDNGWYVPEDGSIHIDLYAGADGKGTMLFTAAHELTHFIKDQSPEKFQALSDFLMEQYGKKGVPVQALVEQQMAKARKHGNTLDPDGAFEEVVADSMESMLADGKVLQELKQWDKGLWQTVKDYVLELCEKIRKVYKRLKPDSLEGRMVAEMKDAAEEMRRLFVEGLQDAAENFTGGEAQKNTTQEGGVKHSIRETTDGRFVAVVDNDILSSIDTSHWNKETKNAAQKAAVNALKQFREGIVVDGITRKVNKISVREFTRSKGTEALFKNRPDIFADKMRTSDILDDVIVASTDWSRDGGLKHPRADNFEDFDHGKILIQAGNNRYSAEVVVGITSNGDAVFYDVVNMVPVEFEVKRRNPPTATTQKAIGDMLEGSSEGRIAQETEEVKKKFSMREPVEYTKNLVALHNLTEEKLKKALNLGGFPMPSIAITKADIPHTNFGDITLVFGRETIDPKVNKKNIVYSADAWTPTVPATEYEEDRNAHIRISQTLRGLEQKIDDSFQSDLKRVYLDLEGSLNRYGGEEGLIQHVSDNYGLKAAYLEEKGKHVDKVTVQEKVDNHVPQEVVEKFGKIMDILDVHTAKEIGSYSLQEARDQHGAELEAVWPGMTKNNVRLSGILSRVMDYLKNGNPEPTYKTVTDVRATKRAVDVAIDQEGYESWVRELFSGIQKDSGVYNNKPLFTASGNRRTFQQTHLPVTLNNIVKAMTSQNGGSTKNIAGFNGIKTLRAGTAERFKSIETMHKGEGRLQNLTEEQLDKVQGELQNRLYSIIETIDQEGEKSRESNPYIRYDAIGEILMEISEKGKYNVGDIQAVFRQYSREISDDTAMDIKKLLYDVSQMPVNLFEAKPERAIGFEEVKAAILPEGTNQGIVDGLRDKGIPVKFYEAGNDGQRLEMVNAVENVKFSLRDQDVRKMNDVLEKQNEKLREDVASLKELLKLQKSVTGGKLLNQNSLDTVAGHLMRSSGAKGNKAELSGLLKDVYSYIAGDEAVTWDGIMEKAQPAADWLSEHMETKQQPDPYGAEVLKELRGSRIYLDESQMAETQYQFGSVNAFRKQLFGTVTITDKDAVSLDSKWAELSQMYPDVFDPNTSASDMPGALLDAIDSLKNMGIGEMWYDKEAARQDLLQQIYDGYWKVSTLYTVADVKQKQIDRLKGEHIARLNKIKAQNREDIQKLKSEHRADMKKLREDMRKSSLEKQDKIRKQYQDSRAKSVEGRNRTEMRHNVQRVVKDLNDLLLNGTKEKHVPIELQKAAAEALDAVNMDTVGAEERIAKLEDALTKTKDPKKIQEISRKIENIQKMGSSMQEKLQRLKAGYDAIMQSEDPLIANAYSPEIAGQLMTLTVTAGDTPLRDMSLKQLEAVYNAYTMVLTTIRNANKTFKAARNATVQELSQKVMTEVSGAGGKRQYSLPAMEAIRKFGWNNLKPVYAFELMGSKTFSDIFKNVRKGEDIWAVDVNEARDFYLEQVKKYGYNQWDMGKQYEFTSATGETFRLGLPQIMSLYAYSKREQAADHLRKGGIVIDETTEVSVKTKLGITMKFNPTEATAYNISDETLIEIVGKLTKEQRAYVDAMQEYLSTVMGEKGNEVSLQMYGIKLFGEKNYFPLRSAQQYLARAKEQQQGDRKIKNAGFSKQTVAHAGNPVVLSGFMDVWAEHVNEMSMYHAFVLPMEDFYRVWNYNTGNKDTEQSRSVNAAVQNAFGTAATGYIDQLLKDLNGGARMDPTTGIISKGMNLFKKGAVFASASVVIQQPSAIGRALSMIDMKYFAGPRITKENHKDSWNQLKKYAPVAAIKEMGYFDTNMGKSTKDYILGQEYDGFGEKTKALFTDSGYRDEALSRGAALADEITWCNIWEAVKRETKAKHPDLSVRSETFLQMAGERFTDVIVKTQVYDSVLSRSGNMRAKDTGMKMATAFMAEPTTSMNMIVDALVQGKRNGAEGRRHCRRAIGAVVAAQVINSILVSFVYAARDDDEDETYLEKYVEALTSGLLDSLNPANYIPFLKDIVSIFQGYDVERSDMAVVSDLWKAYKRLGSKKLNPWRKVEEFAGSLCQIFGVPLKNIMRDARGLYQMVNTLIGPEKTTIAGLKYAVQAGSGKEVSLYEQMYQAYILGDQEHLERVADRFMRNSDAPNDRRAEKELQSGFQNYMKKQFLDEKVTEQEVRDILHGYLEMDPEDVDAALNQWKGELETGKTESNMEDAYLRKEISGEEYMDYLQTYSGKSQEQAKSAELKLRCERDEGIAYNEIKELYMDGELPGDRASALMETYDEETSQAKAKEKVLEWDFESAYGIAYSDRKRAFLDGEISETDLLAGLQKYGGYDKEDAEEYVEKLVFEDKHGFAYSEKKSAYLNGEVSRSVLKNILIQEIEYSEENAELTMQAYDWQKVHPESKYDTTSIKSYLKPLENLDYSANACGIPVDTFVKGKAYVGTLHGEKNSKGKWIPNSRINKAFPYIDNLPLTSEQKTAFAVACGWSLKTVKKNKLW